MRAEASGRWRRRGIALAAAVAAVGAVPAAALPSERVATRSIAAGVVHEVWMPAGSNASIQLGVVEAGAPVRFQVVSARGGLRTGRETVSSMCARTRGCILGVNGDFYNSEGAVGGVIAEGTMLRSPSRTHPQLSLDPLQASQSGLGAQGWEGRARSGEQVVSLSGVNVAGEGDQVILYTSAYGARTPACTCTELVLRGVEVGRTGRLGAEVPLEVAGRGQGESALSDAVVLAGHGAGAQALEGLTGEVVVGITTARPVRASIGAHPILLRGGGRGSYDNADPTFGKRHPRTAVGWDGEGRVWVLTSDGRRRGGPGLTADEVGAFLSARGAREAVMEDGGGSSTFVIGGKVVNAPSDGEEREVANALLLVAAPKRAALRAAPPVVTPLASSPAPPSTPPAPAPAPSASVSLSRAPAPAPSAPVVALPAPAQPAPAPSAVGEKLAPSVEVAPSPVAPDELPVLRSEEAQETGAQPSLSTPHRRASVAEVLAGVLVVGAGSCWWRVRRGQRL